MALLLLELAALVAVTWVLLSALRVLVSRGLGRSIPGAPWHPGIQDDPPWGG